MSTKNGGFLKLLYNNGTEQDMPTVYDLYTPDGSYAPVGEKPLTPSLKNGSVHSSSSSSDKLDESNSSRKMQAGSLMFEDDFMAAQFIRFGDRVRLRKPGARPGMYFFSHIKSSYLNIEQHQIDRNYEAFLYADVIPLKEDTLVPLLSHALGML